MTASRARCSSEAGWVARPLVGTLLEAPGATGVTLRRYGDNRLIVNVSSVTQRSPGCKPAAPGLPQRVGGQHAGEDLAPDEQSHLLGVVEVPSTGRADQRQQHPGDVVGRDLELEARPAPAVTL